MTTLARKALSLALASLLFTTFGPAGALAQSGPPPAPGPRGASFEEVDAYVERQLAETGIPGAALAIVQGDRIVHTRGFGVSGPSGRPVTPQTPFITGSTAKSVTALAVMQLVEAGRVELDAPVRRYLPWFRLADSQAAERLTVRHLLHHTSGLSTLTGRRPFLDGDQRDGALERHVRALADARTVAAPGQVLQYSNANYVILGLIVQAVTGQSYESYVQERIFAPLGMRHSHALLADALADRLATPHLRWFGVPVAAPDLPVARGMAPAAFLSASAEDIGRYLIAHLNGGAPLLSPSGVAALHRPAVPVPGGAHYAMGWYVRELDGERVVFHHGEVPGYTADMYLAPESQLGLVLLKNSSNTLYTARDVGIGRNALRLLLGQAPEPADAPLRVRVAFAALLAVPLFHLLAVMLVVHRIHRWIQPARRPGRPQLLLFLALPLALDVALAYALLVLVPRLFDADVWLTLRFAPDAGLLLLLGGGFALLWAPLRTVAATWLLWPRTALASANASAHPGARGVHVL